MSHVVSKKECNMKLVCRIYPSRLSCLQYAQLSLKGVCHPIETCRNLIINNSLFACIPRHQHKKIGILFSFEQQNTILKLLEDFQEISKTFDSTNIRSALIEDIIQCLVFTLPIRLASEWNPIGKWLIHANQDWFLNMEDYSRTFHAVRFNFLPSDGHDTIDMWVVASELRLFPVAPQDIDMTSEDLTHLMEDPRATISLNPSASNRFYYLPKVTVGKLMSISRCLPNSSPFKDYNELCSYWQQQYGYMLPGDPNGIVYFNVMFGNDGTVYTYPSCCVFLQQPEALPISDKTTKSTIRKCWNDINVVLKNFPGKVLPETWLSNPFKRTPWHQKLTADLEYDTKMRSLIKTFPQSDRRVSKYFLKLHVDHFPKIKEDTKIDNSKSKKEKKKNVASQPSPGNKITKYFSAGKFPSQHSNVEIRRLSNKVTFKPTLIARDSRMVNTSELRY